MKDYYISQLDRPYESTKQLFTFISNNIPDSSRNSILDACCGTGAWSFYIANQRGTTRVEGFDKCADLIDYAKNHASELGMASTTSFRTCDIYNLSDEVKHKSFDGICLVQTLSWLPDWKDALTSLSSISHSWIALSSLFYRGRIEAKTEIKTYAEDSTLQETSPYNVLSIPLVEDHLVSLGYTSIIWHKYIIPIDLRQGDPHQMGSFTQRLDDGTRLQFSGPISMPWYFLLAKKS